MEGGVKGEESVTKVGVRKMFLYQGKEKRKERRRGRQDDGDEARRMSHNTHTGQAHTHTS